MLPSRIIRRLLPCLDRLQEPDGRCGVDEATLSNVHQLLADMGDDTVVQPCSVAAPMSWQPQRTRRPPGLAAMSTPESTAE